MQVIRLNLAESHLATGIAIVIDVIRAFTAAPIAFERGAQRILFVSDSDEGRELKQTTSNSFLMGEERGLPPPGFDYGNSPSELLKSDLTGATGIQRTSSGTQGIVRTTHCDQTFAASFVNVQATIRAVQQEERSLVSIINTGARDDWGADEDQACGDYIEQCLLGANPDPKPYLDRARACSIAEIFLDSDKPEFPRADLEMATEIDRCDFAIRVSVEDGLVVGKPYRPGSDART